MRFLNYIASGAIQEPDLLLADEPTSSLDLKTPDRDMERLLNGDSRVGPTGKC
jgi:ABC-type lipoprotein export system ATPase subunit